jgi:hypothetical protein
LELDLPEAFAGVFVAAALPGELTAFFCLAL